MARNDEDIRQRNKDAAQSGAFFWIGLANQRQSEIIHELLAICVVLLPLSASILLSKVALNQTEKIFLASSWLFLLISIVFGLVQIITVSKYFIMLSNDSSKREELWSETNRSVSQISKDVDALGKTPSSSAMWPIYIQGISFFVALLILVLIGVSIILKPVGNSSYRNLDRNTPFYLHKK